jgi:hypothetical protein
MNGTGDWGGRDPDLGRERATRALGRRDWNWFTTYPRSSQSPADTEPATSPWAGHPIGPADRHDRTLGIPPRDICMWPDVPPTLPSADPGTPTPPEPTTSPDARDTWHRRADAVIEQLAALPRPPTPADVRPEHVTQLLSRLAPSVHGRPAHQQYAVITRIAAEQGLPGEALLGLARDTGNLIAKTTHRAPAPVSGEAALNRLVHADLEMAAELLLARARLDWAATHSDPDLPRLWILANGLHHGVPADVLLTRPARSHGPIARAVPEHRDLVGWHGIHPTIEHLQATLRASLEGHAWLAAAKDTLDNRLLGFGILQLTHPRTAHELAVTGLTNVSMGELWRITARLPGARHLVELTDAALKAVCDRNGWLHGTPDERTHRELVERHTGPALTRHDLAVDPQGSLGAAAREAPPDAALDSAVWRHHPPSAETVQARQLLGMASREALARFADHSITPHPTRAAAITARFPDRAASRGLRVSPDELAPPGLEAPADPQPELDLGL